MSGRQGVLLAAALAWGALLASTANGQSFSEMVEMRDGVNLATDVFLPPGEGPWPAMLYRTPYGRDEFHGEAQWLNGAGIAMVTQDMRGRFDSEGVDMVFTTDGDGPLKDGYDTCAWLVGQEWSDGLIGTSGGSARGIVQYMQSSADPPGLVVINPQVATPNLYQDAMFYGGVRRYALSHNWLEGQGSLHFEDELTNHPFEDEFWDSVQTHDQYGNVHVAGLHVGGWFDIFQQGTIDGYVGYQHDGGTGAAGNQMLVIGPWSHIQWGEQTQGELTFPPNSTEPPNPEAFEVLFNHFLELDHPGVDQVPDDIPNVQYYVMGDVDDAGAPGNQWRTADDWPPAAAPIRLHLQPGGGLAEACPAADGGTTSYVFDPEDPSPTICGANMTIDAGSCDQRSIEARDDVVVFETDVLAAPMEVTGRVYAHLFTDLDQPDADLNLRMTDVYPDGRSMLIADGAVRLATRGSTSGLTPLVSGEIVEGVVDLWSTSLIVNTGHRLRISVTSSNWPRFSVSHNNGLPYPESVEGDGAAVTVTIHHDGEYASYLEIPDPTRPVDDVTTCDGSEPGDDDTTADDDDTAADDDDPDLAGGDCQCRAASDAPRPVTPALGAAILVLWITRRRQARSPLGSTS